MSLEDLITDGNVKLRECYKRYKNMKSKLDSIAKQYAEIIDALQNCSGYDDLATTAEKSSINAEKNKFNGN